jgi:hypothetical protein
MVKVTEKITIVMDNLNTHEIGSFYETFESDLRMSFKTAVFTGMRYKELKLFAEHPEWFNHNRNIIIIPRSTPRHRTSEK